MTDCSLPLDLRHYPKSHLCFTSLSQDFEFRNQQNPFVFFANWLALPSINHRNHAVLIWTGEASIASPDSTHRFLPDPYFGHGDWINVFPSKFSIAIVMFWFSWKFLFGHNNNVQVLYSHRYAWIFCRDFDMWYIPLLSSRSDSNAHQNPIPDLAWKLFLFKEPVSAEINMLEACWVRHRFPYRQTYEKLEEPNPVMSTREHLPFGNHLNFVSASREEALTKKQRGSETGAKTKKGIKLGAWS